MQINRLSVRKVVAIAACLTVTAMFSGCNKDEVIVKFDKKTFIEQKKLWQLSNTKDYEYHLLADGFVYYYGKIIVENGNFKNDEILHEYSHPIVSTFSNYSTIDLIYETIEGMFNSCKNETKKSDFYCTEIFVEYDKINHVPIKIEYKYYCSPNIVVDGTFDFTITNFNKLN
ncbi:MAG: DUF6174 domain-containing protein [Marinilabiliaceae bacterium]|nr:DUF6174 domain-containing protein [Marinilabiliaceae bacterium]